MGIMKVMVFSCPIIPWDGSLVAGVVHILRVLLAIAWASIMLWDRRWQIVWKKFFSMIHTRTVLPQRIGSGHCDLTHIWPIAVDLVSSMSTSYNCVVVFRDSRNNLATVMIGKTIFKACVRRVRVCGRISLSARMSGIP
jgi:hypothetical protein